MVLGGRVKKLIRLHDICSGKLDEEKEKTELTHDDSHFSAIFATPAQTLHLLEEKQKLEKERILKEKEEKDKIEFKKSVINPKVRFSRAISSFFFVSLLLLFVCFWLIKQRQL